MKRLLFLLPLCLLLMAQGATTGGLGPGLPNTTPSTGPGAQVNNWYTPDREIIAPTSWANPGTSTQTCSFGLIRNTLTIGNLGVFVGTLSAGGNVQVAIYTNGSWGRPANLVVASGSISTAATGVQTISVTPTQVVPGGYWFCSQFDNATAILVSTTGAAGLITSDIGSATANGVLNATTAVDGVKIASTFGTWASFTSATVWSDNSVLSGPLVAFKAISVP